MFPYRRASGFMPDSFWRSEFEPDAMTEQPPCPLCGVESLLHQVYLGESGLYLRTFRCQACDHQHASVCLRH